MGTSYIKLMLQLDVSKRLHTDNGFASAPCSTTEVSSGCLRRVHHEMSRNLKDRYQWCRTLWSAA